MAHRSARGVAAGAGGGVVCRGVWGVWGGRGMGGGGVVTVRRRRRRRGQWGSVTTRR